MLDKVIFSIMQSPKLLKDLLSENPKLITQYSLSPQEVIALKEIFSIQSKTGNLAIALAKLPPDSDQISWWPPIIP